MSEVENKRGDSEEGAESGAAFRVIDRRRFAADGSEREEQAPEAAAPAPEAKPEPRVESAPGDAKATQGPDFVLSDAEQRQESHAPLVEPTLSTLLLSLSTQALMLLGEIPDLSTGESQRDLPAARNLIDLIAVLEKKTRGNLDADESALFERILYDLRMRFVEVARS